MKLKELVKLLNCTIYTKSNFNGEHEIEFAFCADLMSDTLMVLRTVDGDIPEQTIIITGLVTNQSIRTAEMLDIPVILFVRGKVPQENVIELALEAGVTLLGTNYTMFTASGELYKENIKGINQYSDEFE